ncbi:cupredoxin domain-containing protein [Undibacterium umbellatum]|uniref:Copper oxidase n=1 Tax=Undibacterium umbellatum TaxID=2762300 RepID=A0ABR6ZDQ8_9BURK|nr:copper oxidase [Undibacterium umbellatum]MBC3909716.1 copper oxidase [Undibacterium umbellatum]
MKILSMIGGSLAPMLFMLAAQTQAAPDNSVAARCERTITADVVAIDQAMMINRLGTSQPGGMVYALRGDVVAVSGSTPGPGNAQLRPGKRPRPMVLRANVGDCLMVNFQNWLKPANVNPNPQTKNASVHIAGMELVSSIRDDGSFVGNNAFSPSGNDSGIIAPGRSMTYRLYAAEEGSFLLYSLAGQEQLTYGLFGSVNVQPRGSEWYRSQVTQAEMQLASANGTAGYPVINYGALLPGSSKPVLKMLDARNNIVHSDLTAIITGPNHGPFTVSGARNPSYPNPESPYREVTVMYHDSFSLVQAFPQLADPHNVLSGANDAFSINYGSAGISAEILANRLKVGPTADCPECKFEEFFLSSWAGGDPAMVVDNPANLTCSPQPCTPPKATVAYYPDDPSNVYHTYQGDRARFRVLHAGQGVFHVHHHHAHQWLYSPDSDTSSYLDSQTIGPGTSYTMDLVYDGSGNRNLTPGDSIFHCHFYPHFASGMWALFRVHDVLELGTPLGSDGKPRAGSRALPDAEILAGTPIPGLVPLPTRAMAPLPAAVHIDKGQVKVTGAGNPGYPFFVPGIAGHRAPHPPNDFAVENGVALNGGLPRHLITGGTISVDKYTQTDFTKEMGRINAIELPEQGTVTEQAAMAMHEQKSVATWLPDGRPAQFAMNGLQRAPGAPFANPARGATVTPPVRIYKGAAMQTDVVLNKKGWHFPQQRILALWQDVKPILSGDKPPEPLFFRANSNDVVEYWHTNLVPSYYELDDFQVRTPTDIIGQHIHLVKFDVLASDGAANGFNYEDGTFSPDEVRARITGINQAGGIAVNGKQVRLTPKAIASFGDGPTPGSKQWVGAQATVQRWWVDPVMDKQKADRTLLTVFTHDHFGPSTHQMVGLYAGLVVEPTDSRWTSIDGKTWLGGRSDGGPTSYAANILPRQGKAYREFALAVADSQFAYLPSSRTSFDCYPGQDPIYSGCKRSANGTYTGWADPLNGINCVGCSPVAISKPVNPPTPPKTKPSIIGGFGIGVSVLNYRNESLALRVASSNGAVNSGTDLAGSYRSILRNDAQLNVQPAGGANINPGCVKTAANNCFTFPRQPVSAQMAGTDPFTPILHVYENDPVQLRIIDGALVGNHTVTVNGNKWLFEPFDTNSGYRGSQTMGLSEHFETLFTIPQTGKAQSLDYLVNASNAYDGNVSGAWSLMRSHNNQVSWLSPLPGNSSIRPVATTMPNLPTDCTARGPCVRQFKVSATTIQQLLGSNNPLLYNSRGAKLTNGQFSKDTLNDPNAIVYVQDQDLNPNGTLKSGLNIEPLALRAAAGDVIKLQLTNRVNARAPVFTTSESAARPNLGFTEAYANINLLPSTQAGLHPQLLAMDVSHSDGMNVGLNPVQTVAACNPAPCTGTPPSITYTWYAGTLQNENGVTRATPVEFGALNLTPADPLMQAYHGLFGGMIIEPLGAKWQDDPGTHISSTVSPAVGKPFRDFAVFMQTDIAMQYQGKSLYGAGTPMMAVNYRSEPFFYRYGTKTNVNLAAIDTTAEVSNTLVNSDPQTPVFRANAGTPVRFRLFGPLGLADSMNVFELTGHQWQFEPYADNSTRIASNPASLSTGTQSGYGTTSHFDVVVDKAGGSFAVPGDYLYRSWPNGQYGTGGWGVFRVSPAPQITAGSVTATVQEVFADIVVIDNVVSVEGILEVTGSVTVRPGSVQWEQADSVTIMADGNVLGKVAVDQTGRWQFKGKATTPSMLEVRSAFGGLAQHRQAATILTASKNAIESVEKQIESAELPLKIIERRKR